MHRSVRRAIETQRAAGRIALMPFIPAGYPDLAVTAALLPALQRAGAAAIEIGIPFSDPIADGPTIQEAFALALAKRIKLADIFATIRAARNQIDIPLVAMVSYSVVYRYGLDRFLKDASEAGFDGLILPDLPPPEARDVCQRIQASGLETVLLIAPTTQAQRRSEIASLCTGFVYYLSVAGTTGERDSLPTDIQENLRQVRAVSQVPVCVGFGISRPEHVSQLAGHADGAIVGSAIVRRIKQHLSQSPQEIAGKVEVYARELLASAKQ